MRTLTPHASEAALTTSRALLEALLGDYHPRDFAFRFWDGSLWEAEPGQPTRFTIRLQHPGSLRRMFIPNTELNLGRAYVENDFDIEGDITAIFDVAQRLTKMALTRRQQLSLASQLLSLPTYRNPLSGVAQAKQSGRMHSRERDKKAVEHHYNLSNDFYALWLDSRMVYTCAYFASPNDSLDQAQEQKLEYLCRKLRLQPGDRLLDIGCGWGGLLIYAARHYGVYADGITLSEEQAKMARERIAAAGLSDRCHVYLRDYREGNVPASYDKLVSVEMFEQVGEAMLPVFFREAYTLLKPGGVFVNQGIARHETQALIDDNHFLRHYVFPDGDLAPLSITVQAAEAAGLEVRDVESLREHYARTLNCWLQNLEANAPQIRQLVGEPVYRVYRMYLAGARNGFIDGTNNLFQVLFVKPDRGASRLPIHRDDWYRPKLAVGAADESGTGH